MPKQHQTSNISLRASYSISWAYQHASKQLENTNSFLGESWIGLSPKSQSNGAVREAVDVPACAYCPALYASEVMDGWSASSLPSPLPLRWPVSIAPLSRCLPWTLSNIINHWTTNAHGHKGAQRAKEVRGQGRAAVLTPIAIQGRVPKCSVHATIWKCAVKSQKHSLNVYFRDLLDHHIHNIFHFSKAHLDYWILNCCMVPMSNKLHPIFIFVGFRKGAHKHPLRSMWSLYLCRLNICLLSKTFWDFV